jgi:very-long-chain (3R)-3-hydroxyacyl-CoA dehydratase
VDVEFALKAVQTAAVLEVVHSAIGFVRSPVGTTFMQVFSRVWTLWAVMHISVEAQTSVFFTLACTSWALVEVPRYLFYALNIIDALPYPLFWLRYSLFAVLYPTGITGELGCMYLALFTLKGDFVSPFDIFVLFLIAMLILFDLLFRDGETL